MKRKGKKNAGVKRQVQSGRGRHGVRKLISRKQRKRDGGRQGGRTPVAVCGDIFS